MSDPKPETADDPRVKPLARRLCSFADDEWRLGRVLYTKQAVELLTIADASSPASKPEEVERAERQR